MPSLASGLDGTDPFNAIRLALSSASKSRRPFKSAKELEEVLLDTAKKSTSENDAAKTAALYRYAVFVSDLARESLESAQAYHFHVAKEELEGNHSIVAPNGHFHAEAFAKHILSSRSRPSKRKQHSSSPSTSTKVSLPPGSCKNHPDATSHSTENCKMGKKQKF